MATVWLSGDDVTNEADTCRKYVVPMLQLGWLGQRTSFHRRATNGYGMVASYP